jgi:hypothetical protein
MFPASDSVTECIRIQSIRAVYPYPDLESGSGSRRANMTHKPVLRIRIRDPGSGAFLTPGSGMGKKQDPDPGCSTWIIFPKAWNQFFWVKILKLFDGDPGSKTSDQGWKTFGSGINILKFPTLTNMEKIRNFMF